MIEIDHVTKSFRRGGERVRVLDDISLHIRAGAMSAVVGPSGAGKSTLARCVNLLERPDSGVVRVGSETITGLRGRRLRAARRHIGMIFQSSSLLSHRTAAGNIAFALEVHGIDARQSRRRVSELLERVGLSDHATAYPSQLSGGQRQRIGIARALALNPAVLLSDEATSGLDPGTTESILLLLRELRDDLDLTVLLITHEMDIARRFCDQISLLEDGRLIETGTTADLAGDARSRLGRLLFPFPPTRPDRADEIELTLVLTPDQDMWLSELTAALGVPVRLLGASIESIGHTTAGAAVIAVPEGYADKARLWLHDNGIHVHTRGAPASAPLAGNVS
ncbi:methionine ABC transporter ATP-binding protein [Nocardia sp. NPDC059239]|uniref:methionine ABC transporter ATP-binding protein n=1 Tax=Nocardia sp. NPDC059239 TaxID=3346785 RepID=UPI0036A9A5A7